MNGMKLRIWSQGWVWDNVKTVYVFPFTFFARSINFFQPFLLISLLFTRKLIEKLGNGTVANVSSLAKSQELYLRFLCRLVWLKLLLITYQIHEKHFVRNQEYWNEDWNKSSNGEWTLQRINMGVLLSIWRRDFRGIPFRNKFIIYMNFKPCPWRLFTTTFRIVFFSCRSFIPISFSLSPF